MLRQAAFIIGVFAVIAVMNMWSEHSHTSRIQKSLSLPHADKSVFVLIPAAGKDAVLDAADTLESLFSTADVPTRVHVGVVQHADSVDDVMIEYRCIASRTFEAQVHVLRYPMKWKEGACAARALGMRLLYTGQSHVLWTDAHSRFCRGWDTMLLEELESLPPQSVLTTLPPQHNSDTLSTFVRVKRQNDHTLPVLEGLPTTKPPVSPLPSPFFSAAFAFAAAPAFQDFTIEPHLTNACLVHTAQLLDRGWRLFAPAECPVTHDWSRSGSSCCEPSPGFIKRVLDGLANRAQVESTMGIDLASGDITEPRVQQGLMPESARTRDEMVCKVGTSVALSFV